MRISLISACAILATPLSAAWVPAAKGDVPSTAAQNSAPIMHPVRSGLAAEQAVPVEFAGPEARGIGALCQEPASRCQNPSLQNARRSDGPELIAAEDFRPATNGAVASVCWWGTYGGLEIPSDAFAITYYEDNAGLPGAELASFSQAGGTLVVDLPSPTDRRIGRLFEYEYVGSHAGVPVNAGQCYWIEIRNGVPADEPWYWSLGEPGAAANGRAVQDGRPLNGYDAGDVIAEDLAFCLWRKDLSMP